MANLGKRFADYFVVTGLDLESGLEADTLAGGDLNVPPLLRPYKAKIISHYPSNVPWNPFDANAVQMMCFPRGLSFTTNKKPKTPTTHPFVITKEDSSRVYGVCLTYYEEVLDDNVCQAMALLQVMHCTEVDEPIDTGPLSPKQRTISSPASIPKKLDQHRGRKSLSSAAASVGEESPFSRSVDRLYVTKAICILMQQSYYSVAEKVLLYLYDIISSPVQSELPLESYIYNFLYEVPLPSPGRSVSFSLGPELIILQSPGSLELPLMDVNFMEVCHIMGLKNLIEVFTCVLLEQRILLCSSEYRELVLVAECLAGLLFPFAWQHVYVPILPASLQNFLDAPVPFIMGLFCDPTDKSLIERPSGVCFVDLDCQIVDLPEDLPAFPHKDDLMAELHRVAATFKYSLTPSKGDPLDPARNSNDDSGMSSTDESISEDSKPDFAILDKSEAMARVTEIAKKTGVIGSIADFTESFVHESRTKERHKQRELAARRQKQSAANRAKFCTAVREVFLNQLMHLFASYEKFIILPEGTDMNTWLTNREVMLNFDKETFLCDQPEVYLPFLCSFIETQMFTSFIDNKIISNWEDADVGVYIFDDRLSKLLDKAVDRLPTYHQCTNLEEPMNLVEKRMMQVDSVAPTPHPLDGLEPPAESGPPGVLPFLDERILNNQPTRTTRGGKRRDSLMLPDRERQRRASQILDQKIANPDMVLGETQWKFVTTLLGECKSKTKKILVDKMGHEAVALGHGDVLMGMEESTLIASLCDLLERIWSHGLINKQSKSNFWQHLKNFIELQQMNDKNKKVDTFRASQPQSTSSVFPDAQHLLEDSSGSRGRKKSSSLFEEKTKPLDPLPADLAFDFHAIDRMSEIKTDVGKGRAWIRLCLEKKALPGHLEELLRETELTKNLYKRYAFLRSEEERIQAMHHLFTLNAADFYCFTNNFNNASIPYRVLIFPGKRFPGGLSTTTANCWLVLAGQFRESNKLNIPRNTHQFHFESKSLGILTTLRIGHDNTGISPKWLVDGILVRNEITGHTYRFPCGRWLGRGVDDGSTERVLVGDLLPHGLSVEEAMASCQNPSSSRKTGSPKLPRRPSDCKLGRSELQHILGDAINNLVKYFCKPEKERGSITVLLCGDYGLVNCVDMMFQSGFKSTRLFRNNLYVWDYFERVYAHLMERKQNVPSFYKFMDVINASRSSIGKDGKFQQLICLAIRDHLLAQWLPIFRQCPVTAQMYDDTAFLRDTDQVRYLVTTLTSLHEFRITLEPSLTKGLRL